MWFELTAQTLPELMQRSRNYLPNKGGSFGNVTIKGSVYVSGGQCMNLNPQANVRCAPQLASQLESFSRPTAEPQGHIHDTLDCGAGDRVDVVGLLLEMKE